MNIKLFEMNQENVRKRRQHVMKSFKARANAKRSGTERFADMLTARFGSVTFLALNMLFFAVWLVLNTRIIPGLEPFDPFPFGFLTMMVSLEAIFLAIVVLISQNREAKVSELREEFDLQINTVAEAEVGKLVQLVVLLLEKQGVKVEDDPQLRRLLETTNDQIERELEKELA